MRSAFVAITGAIVILGSIFALVEFDQRAGPYDIALTPVALDVASTGSYVATADSSVAGLCPQPPCAARTSIDLRLDGLPATHYDARLEGVTEKPIGSLQRDGGGHVLRWTEAADHTDKARLVILFAGRPIMALDVGVGSVSLDDNVQASWNAQPGAVHLNEIGGFEISTVAKGELDEAPPAGWLYVAWFEGEQGRVDLGAVDPGTDGSTVDFRIERVALEQHDAIVIGLVPMGGGAAFPVLSGTF